MNARRQAQRGIARCYTDAEDLTSKPTVWLVNNNAETFNLRSSGAIATHALEVSRALQARGWPSVVVTRLGSSDPPLGPCIEVPSLRLYPSVSRAARKAWGLRDVGQFGYGVRAMGVLGSRATKGDIVLFNNDPELAAAAAVLLPHLRVFHLFHNHLRLPAMWSSFVRHSRAKQLAVSDHVARYLDNQFGLKGVGVVLNGVDLDLFRPAPGLSSASPVMINFTGRTGIEKGLDLLLRACALLPPDVPAWRLQIVGSNRWGDRNRDPYQDELDRLIQTLRARGIAVQMWGHVGRPEVPAVIRRADIQVVPSRWDEPCALVIPEALASGLAVIASDTGGTPELLDGVGRLFGRDDVLGLRDRLAALLRDDRQLAALKAQARQRARALSWDRTAARLESYFVNSSAVGG